MSGAGTINGPLDQLEQQVVSAGDLERRAEALILGLSAAIKATSNDQNVQRLSRDLRSATPRLVAAMIRSA